jgi:antitoxin VapB
MQPNREWIAKRARIAQLMTDQGLTGLLLTRSANLSWLSCGGQAYVGLNSESAVANILCTPERDYLVASGIEMPRMLAEEMTALPLTPYEFPWFEPQQRDAWIDQLCGAGSWASDMPGARSQAAALTAMRVTLEPEEVSRYRALGAATGRAIEAVTRAVRPGMREFEVAGLLSAHIYAMGAAPVVTLVAADERLRQFRHPIPTENRVSKIAMVVVCARKHGLIVSATRLVSFGALDAITAQRAADCAAVDAAAWHASVPGQTLGSAFQAIIAAYHERGHLNEWHKHHQGGVTGYENREIQARPDSTHIMGVNQAFAWNPSITGTKSEDTMIVTANGPESVSTTGDWPMQHITIGGHTYERPEILQS